MKPFEDHLKRKLMKIKQAGLHRQLRQVESPQGVRIRLDGRDLLNFSSNDYLGLANHPALREAAIKAVRDFGAGCGASRLLCGSLAPFHELEETLAAFKGTEAALTFSSGYSTAVGTLTALVGRDDIVILDKRVHACIVDAAKLSGAKLRIFAHNDLSDLESKLRWASDQVRSPKSDARILIVTESIFSMDGDQAPLPDIIALKDQYGAWLMLDEAHATGLYGANGSGLAEAVCVSDRIEIQMGTLGKALGASGGYICGSRALIDFLVNRARSFIFSTAPVPAAAAAATAGIKLVQSNEGRQLNASLWDRVSSYNKAASHSDSSQAGDSSGADQATVPSAIIPVILGDDASAITAANALREQGFFVPAIRYPTVARGSARLRITPTAAHSEQDVELLASAVSQIVNRQSPL